MGIEMIDEYDNDLETIQRCTHDSIKFNFCMNLIQTQ